MFQLVLNFYVPSPLPIADWSPNLPRQHRCVAVPRPHSRIPCEKRREGEEKPRSQSQPEGESSFDQHTSSSPHPAHKKRGHWYYDNYFRADSFLELLRGEFFSSTPTKWRPDSGMPTFPPTTISRAVNFWPYTSAVASSSGRRVDPSSEMPANKPRVRE